jgi:hypothetical protein
MARRRPRVGHVVVSIVLSWGQRAPCQLELIMLTLLDECILTAHGHY